MKKYILLYLHNPEGIIYLVRYLKYPITMMDTSRPTSMSTQDKKYKIMVMIKTEEIKQYVKNISTLRQNTIRVYGII